MAKNPRNKGKLNRKKARRCPEPETDHANGIVIDLNTYSPRHGRSNSQGRRRSLINANNRAQGQYMAAIRTSQLTFGLGPAGTGKTFCATAMVAEAFDREEFRRIIFTRPAVESGETPGFLPGRLMDKLESYFSTFRGYLCDMLGRGVVECAIKNERILFEPLAFMRGKTFDDAFVILDEAQNCTRLQLKMFLTRIGEDTRVVVNGDTRQTDIAASSGLRDAADRLQGLDNVCIHEFDYADVIRSRLVRGILERYNTA